MPQVNSQSFIPICLEGDDIVRFGGRPTFPLLNFFPLKFSKRSFEPFCSFPPFAREEGHWLSDHRPLNLELSLKLPGHYEVEERLSGAGHWLSDHQSLNLELSLKLPEHHEVGGRLSNCNSLSLKGHATERKSISGPFVQMGPDPVDSVSHSQTISVHGCSSLPGRAVSSSNRICFPSVSGVAPAVVPVHATVPLLRTASATRNRYHDQQRSGRYGRRLKVSPYKGVSRYKKTSRWEAFLWFERQHYLGAFTSPEIAAGAHDRAAIYFGRSELNFPKETYAAEMCRLKSLSYQEMVEMLRQQSAGQSRLYPTYPR